MVKIKLPKLIKKTSKSKTWEEWLEKTELVLKNSSYNKYCTIFKSEDLSYWKSFYKDNKLIYQVAILFYDFSAYQNKSTITPPKICISFECLLANIDARMELSVSKDITLQEFETMADEFYNTMVKYK
jgi:hypothetical protein